MSYPPTQPPKNDEGEVMKFGFQSRSTECLEIQREMNEEAPKNVREERTLSIISMKSLASSSDSAKMFVRSSFDDKNDRNNSRNSSDLGSRGGR